MPCDLKQWNSPSDRMADQSIHSDFHTQCWIPADIQQIRNSALSSVGKPVVNLRQSLDISHTKHAFYEAFVASICQGSIKKCFINDTGTYTTLLHKMQISVTV